MLFVSRMKMDWGSLISSSGGTHADLNTPTQTLTQQWTESKRATCHYQESNHGCCSSLPLYLQTFPPIVSLLVLLPANITLNQTFHNNTSIFVKTPFFFCYLSYFCYKTCTGCLEQQQKYNIQFICNFFCLIFINSLGESSWSFASFWLFQVHCPKYSPSGCWWGWEGGGRGAGAGGRGRRGVGGGRSRYK